jgi:hypothetical protein
MFEGKAKGGKVKMRDERSPETAKVSKKYRIVIPKGGAGFWGSGPAIGFSSPWKGTKW